MGTLLGLIIIANWNKYVASCIKNQYLFNWNRCLRTHNYLPYNWPTELEVYCAGWGNWSIKQSPQAMIDDLKLSHIQALQELQNMFHNNQGIKRLVESSNLQLIFGFLLLQYTDLSISPSMFTTGVWWSTLMGQIIL